MVFVFNNNNKICIIMSRKINIAEGKDIQKSQSNPLIKND